MATVMSCIRSELGPAKQELSDLLELHMQVGPEGKLQTWVPTELPLHNPELHPSMHDTHTAVIEALSEQGGVGMAMKGCWSKRWRRLLTTEGSMEPDKALSLCKKLHEHMRDGMQCIWLARNKVRHEEVVKHRTTLYKEIEQALGDRRKRIGTEEDIDGQEQWVRALTAKRQRAWLAKERQGIVPVDSIYKPSHTTQERQALSQANTAKRMRYAARDRAAINKARLTTQTTLQMDTTNQLGHSGGAHQGTAIPKATKRQPQRQSPPRAPKRQATLQDYVELAEEEQAGKRPREANQAQRGHKKPRTTTKGKKRNRDQTGEFEKVQPPKDTRNRNSQGRDSVRDLSQTTMREKD